MGKMIGVGDSGVPVGEDHPLARLTNEQVDAIRSLHEDEGIAYSELAARYAAPKSTIAAICQYRRRATAAVRWRPAAPARGAARAPAVGHA